MTTSSGTSQLGLAADAPASVGTRRHLALRIWLYGIAGLIFAMVLVGGATRLTNSGLSITEWKPIIGAVPPLSEGDWLDAFHKYQQIPEYKLINRGMSLSEFKAIYWWEWAHRFLGRFIGAAFFAPLVLFWLAGAIPKGLGPKLAGIFLLGGLQGALGWYMVMSGLSERTDVSQYRLTAHLAVAVLIFAAVLWTAFDLGPRVRRLLDTTRGLGSVKAGAAVLLGAVFLQIMLGALVAGTDAGMSHNTWPLIDGAVIPDGLGAMQPWYLNPFENVLTVQFEHRMMAYLVAVLAVVQGVLAWRSGDLVVRFSAMLLLSAVLCQIALGVLTLLGGVQIGLALAHQAGGLTVFALALRHLFLARQS
jgi:cytochrome c oxidase assembly protein subunit 15